ncbi:hypothetical protein EMPS_04103 [Entomortierella parvispora]|uniref:Protein kinase domain-containing protein n=1 Tax=Entomortierella parvispora TaxID=205924 RepID=A0A9P3H806_9FUNG|nr:hypothetical protein EMPS_04103 [Entomortierella parvispora]
MDQPQLDQTPIIIEDDIPSESIGDSGNNLTMMDANPSSVFTDTLSSFSSGHSSLFGGNNNANNNLSTFSSSTSASSRRGSMQAAKVEVRETLDACLTENKDGYTQLKQYILKGVIGQGAFGKVHFAVDENTGVGYAVKEFSKSKLRKKDKANLFKLGPRGRGRGRRGPDAPSPTPESSPLDLIRGEIAILKKLHHPNIVKLYEVLDLAQDDSMYMVFEWCEKGVLMPVSLREKYEPVFSDAECRDVFQQMILGIEYLHEHDIIHRDIKPDNLLRSHDGTVKIVDFGVSEMFDKKGDDLTKKSAGSPAFMAPELCRHDHGEVSGRATDIWSMGVTLHCLRYGLLPYVSESILEMQRVIREEELNLSDEKDERFATLMHQLLEKDPLKRITIDQLRVDPWVTNDGQVPLISKEENIINAVTEVTEEELRGAFQKIGGLATVFKAITKFKRGIKTSSNRSATSSPVLDSQKSAVSESERMQDADEDVTPTSTLVQSITATAEITSTPVAEPPMLVNEALETAVEHVALDDEKPAAPEEPTAASDPESSTPVVAEENVIHAAVEAAQETPKEEKEDEGPAGYQVCDMESGLCYWVPAAKKVKSTPSPPPAEPVVTPAVVVESVAPAEEETKPVSTASTAPSSSNETAADTHENSTGLSHHSTLSSPSQGNGSTSRSSSPTRSLTPGPRLVGKLSRERFAMFEKTS